MLATLSAQLHRYAKGWIVLLLLALDIVFNAVVLPQQLAQMQATSGGTGPIDLLFFYTPATVYGMIEAYGPAGRADYRLFELTGDILYPVVYTLLFSLAMSWLFQRAFAQTSSWQRLNVLPFGAWLFDLLENLGIVTMLSLYPGQYPLLAGLTAICTLVKWLFAAVTVLLLLVGLVAALRNRFHRASWQVS